MFLLLSLSYLYLSSWVHNGPAWLWLFSDCPPNPVSPYLTGCHQPCNQHQPVKPSDLYCSNISPGRCLTVSYCVLLCLTLSYCALRCLIVSYCVLRCLIVSYCWILGNTPFVFHPIQKMTGLGEAPANAPPCVRLMHKIINWSNLRCHWCRRRIFWKHWDILNPAMSRYFLLNW